MIQGIKRKRWLCGATASLIVLIQIAGAFSTFTLALACCLLEKLHSALSLMRPCRARSRGICPCVSVRNDVQCAFGRAVFLAYVVRMLRDPDGKKHPREGEHAPHTPRAHSQSLPAVARPFTHCCSFGAVLFRVLFPSPSVFASARSPSPRDPIPHLVSCPACGLPQMTCSTIWRMSASLSFPRSCPWPSLSRARI